MFWKRKIHNFSPNIVQAKKLAKKRIYKYLLPFFIGLIVEITVILMLYFLLKDKKVSELLGFGLTSLDLLIGITYFVIFDNGAANRLKKEKFVINKKKIENAHTFYYALKYSGFIRLFMNLIAVSVIISLALITFLI